MFRVYELKTNKEVTDDKAWFIGIDGTLYWADKNTPLSVASGYYYEYKGY